MQDSMTDSELAESYYPDLANSSFESKSKVKLDPKKPVWQITNRDCPWRNKNHSTTLYGNKIYVFGGYDGK